MGEKQTIGARVSDELYNEVEEYAESRGIDRSTAIVELLRQGLGEGPCRAERSLEARVMALEGDVQRIESDVCGELERRVSELEERKRSVWWWL